ncbi:NAD(P) transhydrogenase subunit beta [Serratia fonticola]|uniref:proton-translocating NAD(P)(+) transhydrogenase n=1 Tax=Serratia fonticola TaxID=47917 RepID=A0A4U9U5G5_SERFO|nr:NAD(P) transhydrogenase subunit beta [Serratia fonticola]
MGEYRETTAEEVAEQLRNSTSVIITPGYGMAVAQAQYPVAEITEKLRARRVSRCALVFTRWRVVYQAT